MRRSPIVAKFKAAQVKEVELPAITVEEVAVKLPVSADKGIDAGQAANADKKIVGGEA